MRAPLDARPCTTTAASLTRTLPVILVGSAEKRLHVLPLSMPSLNGATSHGGTQRQAPYVNAWRLTGATVRDVHRCTVDYRLWNG